MACIIRVGLSDSTGSLFTPTASHVALRMLGSARQLVGPANVYVYLPVCWTLVMPYTITRRAIATGPEKLRYLNVS